MTVKDRFVLSALVRGLRFCVQVEESYSHQKTTNEAQQLDNAFNRTICQRINLLELDAEFLESITESVKNQQASISTIGTMQD
jgi:hypothetical protein